MTDYLLLASVLISFLLSFLVLPEWIRVCKKLGLVWEDMNKEGHPKNVASSGGIVVVMSFILGVLIARTDTSFAIFRRIFSFF